jgi:hypothetical protein
MEHFAKVGVSSAAFIATALFLFCVMAVDSLLSRISASGFNVANSDYLKIRVLRERARVSAPLHSNADDSEADAIIRRRYALSSAKLGDNKRGCESNGRGLNELTPGTSRRTHGNASLADK